MATGMRGRLAKVVRVGRICAASCEERAVVEVEAVLEVETTVEIESVRGIAELRGEIRGVGVRLVGEETRGAVEGAEAVR
jgi:hypothetical protein